MIERPVERAQDRRAAAAAGGRRRHPRRARQPRRRSHGGSQPWASTSTNRSCNRCGTADEPMCVRDCPGDLMFIKAERQGHDRRQPRVLGLRGVREGVPDAGDRHAAARASLRGERRRRCTAARSSTRPSGASACATARRRATRRRAPASRRSLRIYRRSSTMTMPKTRIACLFAAGAVLIWHGDRPSRRTRGGANGVAAAG